MILFMNFANVKPDYTDMTCPKHDNANHHYTPINVVYTPLGVSGGGVSSGDVNVGDMNAGDMNAGDVNVGDVNVGGVIVGGVIVGGAIVGRVIDGGVIDGVVSGGGVTVCCVVDSDVSGGGVIALRVGKPVLEHVPEHVLARHVLGLKKII